MKTQKFLILIVLIAILSGCLPSLNPIYTENDIFFNKDLVGTWTEADKEKEKWIFEKDGENQYKLTYLEEGKKASFKAHLAKIGEYHFLNLYPYDYASENTLYQCHFIPVHTFSKITIDKDKVVVKMMDPTWVEEKIMKKEIDIEHAFSSKGNLLLTASTNRLQEFALKYAENKEAFQEPVILKRKKLVKE
jgi:hypothetical protein